MAAIRETADNILDRVSSLNEPVLSMYLDVNPAHQGNSPRAIVVRAKTTMSELDVDAAVAASVLAQLEENPPQGHTLALFATGSRVDMFDLDVELPVTDGATGHVAARWGKPYITPLIAAAEDSERYGAVYVDRDHIRIFSVGPAAIDELVSETRPTSPAEWDRLQQAKEQHPGYIASRGGAAYDNAQHHLETLAKKFYEVIAERLGHLVDERELRGLILMGPEADVAEFERALPKRLSEMVVDRRRSLSRPDAPISEAKERLQESVQTARDKRHQDLLDAIGENGTTGAADTIQALQRGQLAEVAIAWRSPAYVWRGKTSGWVAATRPEATHHLPDEEEVEKLPLLDAITDLTQKFNTRLVVLRGEAAERLERDFEGCAGHKRW